MPGGQRVFPCGDAGLSNEGLVVRRHRFAQYVHPFAGAVPRAGPETASLVTVAEHVLLGGPCRSYHILNKSHILCGFYHFYHGLHIFVIVLEQNVIVCEIFILILVRVKNLLAWSITENETIENEIGIIEFRRYI